jgi:hypothetical protein
MLSKWKKIGFVAVRKEVRCRSRWKNVGGEESEQLQEFRMRGSLECENRTVGSPSRSHVLVKELSVYVWRGVGEGEGEGEGRNEELDAFLRTTS